MRFLQGVLLLALGGAAAVAGDRLVVREPTSGDVPPIRRTEPEAGDPPLVWVEGTLETVEDDRLVVRDGEGPRVTVQRFAGGATRFLRPGGDEWTELEGEELGDVRGGEEACVEALLDGETFLAVRVFLGAACGPT